MAVVIGLGVEGQAAVKHIAAAKARQPKLAKRPPL